MKKKSTERRVGLIRHTPAPVTHLPHSIKDMTINNINIYKQMNELDVNREDIFERYEQIIRDLENVIKNLEQKNELINGQRIRLLSQNVKLKQELQSFKENYFMADSCVKQLVLFDIVPEDDFVFEPPKYKKKCNEILEQSQLDLGNHGHFFSQQESAELSVQSLHSVSQQKTPCLNHHHSLIQCKSNNNQAPLRIFYLLILQQQNFIDKLRQLLNLCYQDDSKILLHLLPNGNQLWGSIIQKFFDSVLKGQFENQSQIVRYICENPLIDMLMVSLLKQSLPVENEDQNLNLGNWKRQNISHRALFQGLCNQFDLKLEEDKQNLVFKIYFNSMMNQKSILSNRYPEEQESNLLQSHITERNSVQQISLLPKGTNLLSSNQQSRQQPLFKIWFDHDRQFYRTHVSIRPDNFNYVEEQPDQSRSFKATQKNQSQNNQNLQLQQIVPKLMLVPRDLNKINQNREKNNQFPQQYLRCESKNISKNNSHCCSQYIE